MNPVYETQRLYTREMTPEDLPALAAMLQDEQTMFAYEHAFSDAETLEWLEHQFDRYRQHGHGLWAVVDKRSNGMIGQCGLTYQDFNGQQVLEIGYLLQRVHWHNGYAIEAARGCKQFAFDNMKAHEVFSIIRDINVASMNVAIRNGMVVRGRFIKHYYGVDMPHYAFSIRRNEFERALP